MADLDVMRLIASERLTEADVQQLKESNRIEAKAATDKLPRALWDTYSSFANSEGGLILLGVSENEHHELNVTGVTDADKLQRDFWNTINDRSKVSATVLSDHDVFVRHGDHGVFIVIRVPRANREAMPVFIGPDAFSREKHNGTFKRNNEGDYHCDKEEVLAMLRDSGDKPLDSQIIENCSIDVLNEKTISTYRNDLLRIHPKHPWHSLDDIDFLLRLQAIKRDGSTGQLHPTAAGLLMFGNEYAITQEFPYYFLDYREELGNHRWDDRINSTDGTWSGNLYDFWNSVYNKLRLAIPHPFQLDADSRRVDSNPMEDAVREALTNTIVHADYVGRRGTIIVRYAQTVEFINPGRLRISKEEAEHGGISDPRNPTLMKMFMMAKIGERAGSGFDTMRAGCDFLGIPHPSLNVNSHPDQVRLTLYYINPNQATVNITEKYQWRMTGHLSQSEISALKYLTTHGTTTTSELSIHMNLSASRTRSLLKGLVDDGLAKVIGKGRATRYEPTDNIRQAFHA